MSKKRFSDIVAPEVKFSIVESSESEVDGVHVLAKIRGQFFVPDGKSRNGRFYPKSLWEKVISDPHVANRINKKIMFGTIGHDGELNDKAIREGLVSHVMTHIEIDEQNRGIGEALILNTPVGKILNTVLRAGSQLAVSSRANGTFKGKKDGLAVVDEDTYDIDGWDFVLDPGFLEANPTIAESIENKFNELGEKPMDKKTGEVSMDAKLVEHIANENSDLKAKVGNLTDEITTLQEDKKTLSEENDHLKVELTKWEDDKKVIESYSELGTVEEIKEKLAKAEEDAKVAEAYNELADSPESAKEVMEKAKAFIKTVTEEFGTVDQIREALTEAIAFKKEIAEIGTPAQIKEALESYLQILEAKETEAKEAQTKELAEELGMETEKVAALLEKYSVEDIKELHGSVKPAVNEETEAYKKKNFKEEVVNKDEITEEDSKILGKSRADRINERFNRV